MYVSSMNTEKEQIRMEARRVRDFITLEEEDPEDAVELFVEALTPQQDQVVAGYWPKGKEFDPTPILEHLLHNNHTCALPVVEKGSKVLKFARWAEDIKLSKGPFGIMQPEIDEHTEWLEPDIFLVPLLAFDRRGYRIGQGGGYYDATLQAAREDRDITAVGVCYAKQAVLFNLPVEDHDQRLDWVITTQGVHDFRK